MPKRMLFWVLVLGLTLAFASIAIAQDDDDTATDDDDTAADDDDTAADDDDDTGGEDGFFASTVEFTEPTALTPSEQLLFTFTVTNNAVAGEAKGDWINQVDLTMPSQDYVVDEESLTAPDPLHTADVEKWEVSFDPTTVTITWQTLAAATSMNYGDIREGEWLAFEFTATTDAEATDGFDWALYSDEGNIVTGTAWIEVPDDDDDDTDVGDDDDDDDDDAGCCG